MPAEVLRLACPRMETSASTWLRSFWARARHLDPNLESAQPGLARDARGVQQQPIPRKEGATNNNSRVFYTLLLPRLARSAP